MRPEPRYRIQAVAEMTGIPAPTLRAWERRYGIPRPGRSESSYRLYSDIDVAEVRQMVSLQNRGLAPSEAARLVLTGPPEARPPEGVPVATPPLPLPLPPTSEGVFDAAVRRIVEAAKTYDVQATEREVQAALYLASPTVVYERVLSPAMVAIGELWEAGELDVAAEHLASHATLDVLSHVVGLMARAIEGPRVLLACLADEQHELPLYGAAFSVLEAGLQPVMLGQRTPPSAVASAVARLAPVAVGLSVTMPIASEPGALFRAYVQAAAGVPVFVGGLASHRYAEAIGAAGAEHILQVGALRERIEALGASAARD